MWTWTEIINLALVRSGILGRGQIASASIIQDGMKALMLLLDEWDGNGMALPNFSTDITFNTVAGQAQYLLGPGTPNAYSVRPESIVTGTVTVSTNPISNVSLVEMSYPSYTLIPVPSTSGQPWNYAVNETWPQSEVYLYPTPSQVYPITLTCKVKWAATVGSPDLNPFDEAEVPSGYANALVDNLSLKLAETYRLDTPTLRNKAANARMMVALAVANQNRANTPNLPVGLFSWNILTSGRNP